MRNVNTFKEFYPLLFYMYSSYCLNKRNWQTISQLTNLVKMISQKYMCCLPKSFSLLLVNIDVNEKHKIKVCMCVCKYVCKCTEIHHERYIANRFLYHGFL